MHTTQPVNEALIADVVSEVLKRLGAEPGRTPGRAPTPAPSSPLRPTSTTHGVFSCVNAAVEAATRAQRQLAQATVRDAGRRHRVHSCRATPRP